jgi:hypothetical protein
MHKRWSDVTGRRGNSALDRIDPALHASCQLIRASRQPSGIAEHQDVGTGNGYVAISRSAMMFA